MSNTYWLNLPRTGVPTYANASLFPTSAYDGALAIALDSDILYIFHLPTLSWIPLAAPGDVTAITALIGDGTANGPGSVPLTLATVNSNVGSFTGANITVNGKGLITAAANGSGITALTGDGTASGPGSSALTLSTVNSNVGSFVYGSFTVNGKGLITAASSGTTPVTTLGAFGSSPNANAGTITGSTLVLQPASTNQPGGVSTGLQTFNGTKTFNNTVNITQNFTVGGSSSFAGGIGSIDNAANAFFASLNTGSDANIGNILTVQNGLNVSGNTNLDGGAISTDGSGNLTIFSLSSDGGNFQSDGSGDVTIAFLTLGQGATLDCLELVGQCGKYNNALTVGQGLVAINGGAFLSSASASSGTLGLVTYTTDAFAEALVYLETVVAGTSGTVSATVTCTGAAGVTETYTTPTLTFGTLGAKVSASFPIYCKANTAVTVAATITSGVGSPHYLLAAYVTRYR